MESIQRSLAHPNIKYNCVVLFLSQLYWLFIYASKYFLIDHDCKSQTEFSDLLAKGKILLMFLQGAIEPTLFIFPCETVWENQTESKRGLKSSYWLGWVIVMSDN